MRQLQPYSLALSYLTCIDISCLDYTQRTAPMSPFGGLAEALQTVAEAAPNAEEGIYHYDDAVDVPYEIKK